MWSKPSLSKQALEICTDDVSPKQRAAILHGQANAYCERILGERADNLEQAIHLYKQALQVVTRDVFPEQWATTQHGLARAYRERIYGNRPDNVEQAIFHFKQALEVYTPMTYPQASRTTAYALGFLLYNERRFAEARQVLDIAHQAVEALRDEMQSDAAKRSLAEENANLYACLVSSCLQAKDIPAAFEYAVNGKGRAFIDLLATARVNLSADSTKDPTIAKDLRKAQELHQQINNIQATLRSESVLSTTNSSITTEDQGSGHTSLSRGVLFVQLSSLQAQEASQWEEIFYKYPALTATQKTPILSVEQAHKLAKELGATLVEYYLHAEGWCAFVVTPDTIHHISLLLLDDDLLVRMIEWMQQLEYSTGRSPLSLLRLSEWYEAAIAPLEANLPQDQPIILAPFGILHALPLGAARHPQTGRYVAQDYQLVFTPSLSALHIMWNQACQTGKNHQVVPHRLLNVAFPGVPYLSNVLPEAEAIASHFMQVTPLYEEKATPDNVLTYSRDQDIIHFGCHGWFDREYPEQSGLMLANGWLTIQRIIMELHLDQTHLVTLGACFSGQVSLQRGDEYVGLLQAMLTTGVPAVVASLWSAGDASTRTLFETFYARLLSGSSPAKALQEAAQFVRENSEWAHPYYWAAFQVSGLAHIQGITLGSSEPSKEPLNAFEQDGYPNLTHTHTDTDKGDTLEEPGNPQEVPNVFEQIMQFKPSGARAYSNKGAAFGEIGHPQEALNTFEQAIVLDPTNTFIHDNKGLALLNLNRYQEALDAFERAIVLDPSNAPTYIRKGIILWGLRRYQEALDAFEQAIHLDPTNAQAYSNKGAALTALRRYQEAIEAFERAIHLDPTNAQVYSNEGVALEELERYQEMVAVYEQVIHLNPTNALAHYKKGVALWNLASYQEAVNTFEQAIRLNPTSIDTYNYQGSALLQLGRYQEALDAFEQAIRLDATNAFACSSKGDILLILKRHHEAVTVFEQAIRLNPNYTTAYYNKGVALLELKRYQEALDAYERVISMDSTNALAYNNKGVALLKLKHYREALDAYGKAYQLGYDPHPSILTRWLRKFLLW